MTKLFTSLAIIVGALGVSAQVKPVMNLCSTMFSTEKKLEKRYAHALLRVQKLIDSENISGHVFDLYRTLNHSVEKNKRTDFGGVYSEIRFLEGQIQKNNRVKVLTPEKTGGLPTADFLVNTNVVVELKSVYLPAFDRSFNIKQFSDKVLASMAKARNQVDVTIEKLSGVSLNRNRDVKKVNKISELFGAVYVVIDGRKIGYEKNKTHIDVFLNELLSRAVKETYSAALSGIIIELRHEADSKYYTYINNRSGDVIKNEKAVSGLIERRSPVRRGESEEFVESLAEEAFTLSPTGGIESLGKIFNGKLRLDEESIDLDKAVDKELIENLISDRIGLAQVKADKAFDVEFDTIQVNLRFNADSIKDKKINNILQELVKQSSVKSHGSVNKVRVKYKKTEYLLNLF